MRGSRIIRGFTVLGMLLTGGLSPGPAQASDGFALTQWGRWTLEEGLEAARVSRDLGARHLSVLVMMCPESATASSIDWCEQPAGTALAEGFQGKRLAALAQAARAEGMELSLIPFPMLPGGESRQWLRPRDPEAWFTAYGERLVELAGLARALGVRELVVGSELTLLFKASAGWRRVIAAVRSVYDGHLTLSPVFADYGTVTFWDALDSLGVSAYFPLTVDDRVSSVRVLEGSWRLHRSHLRAVAKAWGKPITFVEVGYPNTDVAASMPWDFEWSKRELDFGLAARCWEAFRRVWGAPPRLGPSTGEAAAGELRSFRVWGLSAQSGELANGKGFSPIGKPAEAPLKRAFTDRAP
ncbi:MAG: hypothetical protein IT285_09345 [Bdellovibrionales bacterium]|nr:hypothetical protein [Bdellovibrionales bacterium]